MVRLCKVCGKNSADYPNLSFHGFPCDNSRRERWLSILNFDESQCLPKRPEICSEHFEGKDFYFKKSGRKFLNQDALPKPLCGEAISCDSVPDQQPQPCLEQKLSVKLLDSIKIEEISSEYTLSGVKRITKKRHHIWLEALGLDPVHEKISNFCRICSAHFDEEDILVTPKGIKIPKDNAIPKLHLGPNIEHRKHLLKRKVQAISTLEEDESNEDDPDLLPDRPLVPVDESIVKIEIEEEPLKIKNEPFIIENDPLTSDTREESTLAQIKDEPSEKPDRLTSETVDQLDESERQSIQMFFDSMARTAMTLSPTFVSRIKSEVLRVVIDIEMEAYKKKMEDLKEPSRKTDTVNVASNETEPKIKIEIEDDAEAETTNELDEPQLLDPDHDANYEPLAKKKKKSKTEQPTSSSSALQVDRTPITLHEPVETFFQSIAYTVTSFPPPFICKAKVAVLNVISKMEVEACRSRQSGYQDGGGGGDASTTRHLLASGSDS